MSPRDRLVSAVVADDWTKIQALGWGDVFRDLDAFWPKKFGPSEAVPYARVLGHRDPAIVHAAILELAVSGVAEWRPGPAQLSAVMGKVDRPKPGAQLPRPDARPETLALVAELLENEPECECSPARQIEVHEDWVLRCADCGGLDSGQVDLVVNARGPQ